MRTFAEFLPTLTAREREIVEAFHLAMESWHEEDNPKTDWPIDQMRTTPPAKEPVSETCELKTGMHVGTDAPPLYAWPKSRQFRNGDRVRITKIEEAQ